MGAFSVFFGKHKLILLVFAIFMGIQGITLVVGGVAAVTGITGAFGNDDSDMEKCSNAYAQVIKDSFSDKEIKANNLLVGCPEDDASNGNDISIWLAIIEEATGWIGRPYNLKEFLKLRGMAEQAGANGVDYSAGGTTGWTIPVTGATYGSPFGPRPNKPVEGVNLFHSGQDLIIGCGTDVHAATAGKIAYAGWLGSYGNWILVDHGNGVQTGYAHNSKLLFKVGDQVASGQVIAKSGTTGASSGCHVHFEVRLNGKQIDPVPFFNTKSLVLAGGTADNAKTTASISQDQIDQDFAQIQQKNPDEGIWQAIIDYAEDKIGAASYNAKIGNAIVDAAQAHLKDKYVIGTEGWNANKQAFCAKSPTTAIVAPDGSFPTAKECGFDDATLIGYAVSKGLGLDVKKTGPTGSPWGESAAAQENWLTNKGHGTVITEDLLMPGDLAFVSYGSSLDSADHVLIYAGLSEYQNRNVRTWINAVNDSVNIIEDKDDNPSFKNYKYEFVRPYSAELNTANPVAGTGDVADAKRYARTEVLKHSTDWGWNGEDWNVLETMWTNESSWRWNAFNPNCHTSKPALPEYQAYGIAQRCPGAIMGQASEGGAPDWKTNYKTQVNSGLKYIRDQYGSPSKAWSFWQKNKWY